MIPELWFMSGMYCVYDQLDTMLIWCVGARDYG
jgi:hypothetical protein